MGQRSYVNSGLESVEIPKQSAGLADHVSRKDNQSTIGALSWLAGQTRPDLQAGVSLCQRKQKHPTNADVRETNQIVKMAQKGKDRDLTYPFLEASWEDLVLLVFHDAAWANAVAGEDDPAVGEGEVHAGTGIYSQLGHVLILASRKVLEGEMDQGIVCLWRSHACPRVCRSTSEIGKIPDRAFFISSTTSRFPARSRSSTWVISDPWRVPS